MANNLLKFPKTPKVLGEKPNIDATAIIVDTKLGRWTEVGANSSIMESTMGDYSYCTHHCQIIYTDIGNFCSIASHSRINPGNHPLGRAALHHFSYRSRMFGMGEDDHEFFEWRRPHRIRLGHDVWLGQNVILLPGVTIGTGAAVGAGVWSPRTFPHITWWQGFQQSRYGRGSIWKFKKPCSESPGGNGPTISCGMRSTISALWMPPPL